MSNSAANDVAYSRENDIVQHYRTLASNEKIPSEAKTALEELCNQYDRLLDDSKLLTSVGDRLQRKLKGANQQLREQGEEIRRINVKIEEEKSKLQETLDELTKANASKQAKTIAFIIIFFLFIGFEIVSNLGDDASLQYQNTYINLWGYHLQWLTLLVSWGPKFAIFFANRPIESVVEKVLLSGKSGRKMREEALKEIEEKTGTTESTEKDLMEGMNKNQRRVLTIKQPEPKSS